MTSTVRHTDFEINNTKIIMMILIREIFCISDQRKQKGYYLRGPAQQVIHYKQQT